MSAGRPARRPPQGLPLAGRRVLVTRAEIQAGPLIRRLRGLGAAVAAVPVIGIEPVAPAASVRLAMEALRRHPGPAWAVFSSVNAVRLVAGAGAGEALGRLLEGVAVAAVGPETAAALSAVGVAVEVVPDEHVAEGLAASLAARGLSGARVWLPGAEGAREVLRCRLHEAGAEVDALVLYRTVLPAEAPGAVAAELGRGPVDAVTFTSASTVRHFALALDGRPFPAGAMAACIGPVTAGAARAAGFPVGAVAAVATGAALADALVAARGRGGYPPR